MRRNTMTYAAFMLAAGVALPLGAQSGYHQTKPLDPANMDKSVNACVDFYQYANGGWLKANPLPPAFSRWGSLDELGDANQASLTKILDAATKAPANASPSTKMLGTYYSNCMDSAGAEKAGISPLKEDLEDIAKMKDKKDIVEEVADLQNKGVGNLFNFGSTQDVKNSSRVIGGASQGGLGLPDRDYYFKQDPASVEIRKNYVAHVQRLFELSGSSPADAAADAQRVMAFESALAASAKTRIERRDPEANYHLTTKAQLVAMTPNWNWDEYFEHIGKKDIPEVDVQNPKSMATVDSLVANAPVADWQAYLKWKLLNRYAGALSSAFVNEDFAFNKTLTGTKEMLPRYKRCTRATDGNLRDVLGQAYVEQNFTPTAKSRALEMIHNMEAALKDRINALSWMSETTKQRAVAKLAAFTEKIGYPDKWEDYSSLDLKKGDYVQNLQAVAQRANKRDLDEIGKPVDRTQWGMTPPTVNAYYNPVMNEIVFPAGILQPPVFSATADDAVNYGGMGSVIGHEMSHGFDDQGAQFDPQGNLKNWWTDADLAAFKQRTGLVVSQYDAYTVLDSVHVQGKLTLGENIGDLGGLNIAYSALENALAKKGRPGLIDGFTPEQRFFLAWAQIWRSNITDAAQRQRILTDPHSPGRWRANGPISNMPEFAKAFGCKPGDPMVRGDDVRASIW